MRVRRTQGERSEETRNRILSAAIELMNKRGYAGFRVIEVMEIAGLSRGAQLHHFRTKDELISAALVRVFAIAKNEVQARVAKMRMNPSCSASDIVDFVIDDACQFFFSDNFKFALDMTLVGSRDLKVAQMARETISREAQPNEDVWIDILKETGLDDEFARDAICFLRSIVRGLMIRSLTMTGGNQQKRVITMARDMLLDRIATQQGKGERKAAC
ncbi:HTH-type transcriptional regulator CymR (plasmid) [Sphingobium sp. AntQ-1]|uniref:TetR/AcrR family transcriptional regulator n=1 Tax=Sphingobium sp. AntQ-1 TaxID=2930091 RepID=UPI00234F6336|nr:TetR/AcrR family transcriptional regulator [Sphingobium sp. AntQ-1]WCP15984.1 HTH-type transcriptional regulator CymR [Sphingobium sp. AntQ-1]